MLSTKVSRYRAPGDGMLSCMKAYLGKGRQFTHMESHQSELFWTIVKGALHEGMNVDIVPLRKAFLIDIPRALPSTARESPFSPN